MARIAAALLLLSVTSTFAQTSSWPQTAETRGPSLFDQAVAAEGEGNGKLAVRLYIQAARAGEGKAARRLGEIYDKGLIGVPRDYRESLKWYNAARTLGYPPLIGDFPPHRSR